MSSRFRTLGLVGSAAVSLALVSPTLAISLNPQAMSLQVGTAVPTVFAVAMVPVAFVAIAFASLASRFGSHGSVLELLTVPLGRGAAQWAALVLGIAYSLVLAVMISGFGIFLGAVLSVLLGVDVPGSVLLLGGVAMAILASLLGRGSLGTLGRILLLVEGLAVLGIIAVTVAAGVGLMTGAAPPGAEVDFAEFSLAGFAPAAIGLALAFAFVSVAGFEGAAAVGDSTRDPRRTIPRALLSTSLGAMVLYVVVSAITIWSLGSPDAALRELTMTSSLPAAAGDIYAGVGTGPALMIAGCLSCFAGALGAVVAGGRIVSALAEDKVLPAALSPRSRADEPVRAMVAVTVAGVGIAGTLALVSDVSLTFAFDTAGAMVGEVFLTVYAAVCLAAGVILRRERRNRAAAIPFMGLVMVLGILAVIVVPLPEGWRAAIPVVPAAAMLGVLLLVIGRSRASTQQDGVEARPGGHSVG